jgi:hypothetical protein
MFVKKGSRYFYNPTQKAVYPYSADLEKIKGLISFTAPASGEFTVAMTLAGSAGGEPAKAVKAQTAKPLTPAQIAAAARRVAALQEEKQAQADLVAAEQASEDADAAAAGAPAKREPKPIKVPSSTLNPVDFQGE